VRLNLLCKMDKPVGFAAHGGYHHYNLVALCIEAGDALRHAFDAFDSPYRSTAVFLYDQRHVSFTVKIQRAAFYRISTGKTRMA